MGSSGGTSIGTGTLFITRPTIESIRGTGSDRHDVTTATTHDEERVRTSCAIASVPRYTKKSDVRCCAANACSVSEIRLVSVIVFLTTGDASVLRATSAGLRRCLRVAITSSHCAIADAVSCRFSHATYSRNDGPGEVSHGRPSSASRYRCNRSPVMIEKLNASVMRCETSHTR